MADNELAKVVKDTLAPVFEKMRWRIAVAYLFGSSASGDAGPKSDIDIAILLPTGEAHVLDQLDDVDSFTNQVRMALDIK